MHYGVQTPGGTTGTECQTCVPTSGNIGEPVAKQTTTTTATVAAPVETTRTEAVCGEERFAKIEDRPAVIERKEYIKEHRPVEKEYVTQTKFVGERELQEGRNVEHLGTEERIIAEAAPKSPCE